MNETPSALHCKGKHHQRTLNFTQNTSLSAVVPFAGIKMCTARFSTDAFKPDPKIRRNLSQKSTLITRLHRRRKFVRWLLRLRHHFSDSSLPAGFKTCSDRHGYRWRARRPAAVRPIWIFIRVRDVGLLVKNLFYPREMQILTVP